METIFPDWFAQRYLNAHTGESRNVQHIERDTCKWACLTSAALASPCLSMKHSLSWGCGIGECTTVALYPPLHSNWILIGHSGQSGWRYFSKAAGGQWEGATSEMSDSLVCQNTIRPSWGNKPSGGFTAGEIALWLRLIREPCRRAMTRHGGILRYQGGA